MVQSIKGAGSLSRKLTAILVLSAMATLGYAADNSIYINQSGDNSAITVTQDGAGNVMRGVQGTGSGNTTPATINGNSNTVTVDQVGTGNILNFGIATAIANGSPLQNGNTYLYTVNGNNNIGTIDSNNNGSGQSASNFVSVTQTGNTNVADVNVLGTNNAITATTAGGNVNSMDQATYKTSL